MIERVARVIMVKQMELEGKGTLSDEEWAMVLKIPTIANAALAMARVAIEAMREPTKAMENALSSPCQPNGVTAWEEMIDEALKCKTRQ